MGTTKQPAKVITKNELMQKHSGGINSNQDAAKFLTDAAEVQDEELELITGDYREFTEGEICHFLVKGIGTFTTVNNGVKEEKPCIQFVDDQGNNCINGNAVFVSAMTRENGEGMLPRAYRIKVGEKVQGKMGKYFALEISRF